MVCSGTRLFCASSAACLFRYAAYRNGSARKGVCRCRTLSARAIVAPKGTPQEIIDFYADAFKKAMEDPEYVDAAEKAGVTTAYMDPEETQKLLHDQYTFCTDVSSKLWNE